MNCLDDVPFRMTASFVEDPVDEANFVHAPEIEMPDCEEILMCAMHDFSLEKKVLYWIDSASRQDTPWFEVTTEIVPTAPPCWLLLVDSKENVAAGQEAPGDKTKVVTPVRRCVSLSTAVGKFSCAKNKGRLISEENRGQCSEEEEESSGGEEISTATSAESDGEERPASYPKHIPSTLPRFQSLPQCRPKTSPVLLLDAPSESSCPKPALLKQRRSMLLFDNVKNELEGAKKRLSAFMHPVNQASAESSLASRAFSLHQRSRSSKTLRYGLTSDVSLVETLIPTPPPARCRNPRPLTAAGFVPPIQKHKPTVAFLSYLSACDKLLKQGYEEAQVEEAMEMFQNSERKAAEFLHLLAQFHDMGFQQAEIKEVLLLCENHRDKALEELITRTQ
ncbi:programmed cell death protein 7 isoform X5 [Hemicordylus capensis]|uniref:programmed cell death protein 7 isoform X5 n=1 Tax=Hemicordylus capensis TaxID=884348 RepID=UPI0023032D22|nr:programmed cell death protein 7 isoform X5 [Hemicordylus capensis]